MWRVHVIPASFFPLHQAPRLTRGRQYRDQDYCMFFCEGTYPRGHGENMQTPHRKALLPSPPRVWALMTRRREHAPSTHSVPSGNRTLDLLAVRRQRYRLCHRAPLYICIILCIEEWAPNHSGPRHNCVVCVTLVTPLSLHPLCTHYFPMLMQGPFQVSGHVP